MVQRDGITQSLIFIKFHLSTRPATVVYLDAVGLPLNTSMGIDVNYINHLRSITEGWGEKVREKATAVVEEKYWAN